MKRHTRVSPNALCLIPGKAIAGIMLTMAIATMVSLMLIEVRRILSVKTLPQTEKLQMEASPQLADDYIGFNLSEEIPIQPFHGVKSISTKPSPTKSHWNYETLQALFEDHPDCSDRPYLLILVTSSPENFERREAIRKSWACMEKWKLQMPKLKSKTLFLVGRSSTKFLDILLKNENDIAGDILIGDYLDTYRNLTLKVMHGLTWSLLHCRPMYLLKTDDDCFVNIPLLLQFLFKFNPVTMNLYAGKVRWSAPVVRDPNSRWYVSSSEYPKQRYAPYANGAGYILSQDVLKRLVMHSDRVRVFPNEDAYVGSVLKEAGIRPTYSGRFVTHPGPWQTCNFLYLFVVHRVKATRQDEYQDIANKAIEQCSMDHIVKDWV